MKRIALPTAPLVLALLAGCSTTTTTLESSWREPSAGPIRFEKVVVLAVMNESTVRRAVEDDIAQRVRGGIAGHTIVPDSELDDPEKVKSRVLASGADGGILLRVIGKRHEQEWVPGAFPSPYRSTWDFYGTSRHAVVDPGYLHIEEYVRFQTNIYDLEKDQLVWSGLTDSLEPDSIPAFVDELAAIVAEALRKEGLISG
jgi:hypothetical protein